MQGDEIYFELTSVNAEINRSLTVEYGRPNEPALEIGCILNAGGDRQVQEGYLERRPSSCDDLKLQRNSGTECCLMHAAATGVKPLDIPGSLFYAADTSPAFQSDVHMASPATGSSAPASSDRKSGSDISSPSTNTAKYLPADFRVRP